LWWNYEPPEAQNPSWSSLSGQVSACKDFVAVTMCSALREKNWCTLLFPSCNGWYMVSFLPKSMLDSGYFISFVWRFWDF